MAKKPNTIKDKNNGFGIASLVLGILSILSTPIGIVPGIVGLILAIKQNRTYKNNISTGGFITSIVGICLGGIILIIVLISLLFFGTLLTTMA